jgi:hypothetical protein
MRVDHRRTVAGSFQVAGRPRGPLVDSKHILGGGPLPQLTLPPPLRTDLDEAAARRSLRAQIAKLEAELAELFTRAFPREGIEWGVGDQCGPRLLGLDQLEATRDELVNRLQDARAALARCQEAEQANLRLIERMLARPADYRWVQVSAEDVGERGCKHWHSRPRYGILGMLFGWWRVKISSGCPLGSGSGGWCRAPKARHLVSTSSRCQLVGPARVEFPSHIEGKSPRHAIFDRRDSHR